MKVNLVSRFFDMRNAGLGRVGIELRDRLIKRGHEVYTRQDDDETLLGYAKYTAFECHHKLPAADVCHAITPMEGAFLPHPSVVTFHDLILLKYPERCGAGVGYNPAKRLLAQEYFRFISTTAARNTDRVVCVSDATADEVAEFYNLDRDTITVIRSGINPYLREVSEAEVMEIRYLSPWWREHIPKEKDMHDVYGYLGQLDRRKRVDILIRDFRLFAGKWDTLLIGGTGRDGDRLKAMAEGDPRIIFLGFVPENVIAAFYSLLDWFIFPTWVEGYGLPLVEAMACRTPTLILEDAIIPWDVKRCCRVVRDLRELFIVGSVAPPSDNELDRAYHFAKEHNWEQTVSDYEDVYREVMA